MLQVQFLLGALFYLYPPVLKPEGRRAGRKNNEQKKGLQKGIKDIIYELPWRSGNEDKIRLNLQEAIL